MGGTSMYIPDEYTERSGLATSFETWEFLLERLRQIERGRVSMLVSYDLASHHGRIYAADNIASHYRRSYAELYGSHDPWAARIRDQALPGTVWSGDQILSHSERVNSRYYNEWLKPQGIAHVIRGVLRRDREVILYVDVGRGIEAGHYHQNDVDTYRSLLPKLQRAAGLRLLVDSLRRRSEAALKALDMMPIGMIIFDLQNHPAIINRYARDLLSASRSASENLRSTLQLQLNIFDRLRERSRSRRVHQSASTSQRMVMDTTHLISISRPDGLLPLSALVVDLNVDSDDCGNDNLSHLVFITDPDRGIAVNRERLQRVYGLTPAEARLAALLARGRRLRTVAAELGISVETARTHLKHIFSKTTSASQVDLVRLLLSLENQVGSSS
jgi:DNA-binding CsgD family transcriptional regulator/PAS domain-containing protein